MGERYVTGPASDPSTHWIRDTKENRLIAKGLREDDAKRITEVLNNSLDSPTES